MIDYSGYRSGLLRKRSERNKIAADVADKLPDIKHDGLWIGGERRKDHDLSALHSALVALEEKYASIQESLAAKEHTSFQPRVLPAAPRSSGNQG